MEEQDHAYVNTIEDYTSTADYFYKMSPKEIENFVKLRVTNSYLFSGRRNTAMWAWRAILKHMGLHHKMSHYQAKKKWGNMKNRYKELKNPPPGVKVNPEAWPYYSLMADAIEGRLQGSAPILQACRDDRDCSDFLPVSTPKKRKMSTMMEPTFIVADGPEIEVSLSGEDEGKEMTATGEKSNLMDMREEEEVVVAEQEQSDTVDKKRHVLPMDRERLVLRRERAVLDRELAVLERDRALLERERATMERERAMIEREWAMVARERDALSRERSALESERAKLGKLSGCRTRNEEVTENGSELLKASDTDDTKERFFSLFEKLLGKLEK